MSKENPVHIQDNSSLHHYRTEIPNIVFDLGLSSDLIGFYGYLKRIAGDKGGCWKSTPSMAKECGCSEFKIRKMKKALSEKFSHLNNLPLIKIQTDRKKEDGNSLPDLVTIIDIWPINFLKISTGTKNEPPLVRKTNQTGSKNEPKEERYEEEPSKKNDNVSKQPSEPKKSESDRDRSSFKSNEAFVPFNPFAYRLPNGLPLSLRCARAFSKYRGEDFIKLCANVEYFEERAKQGTIEDQEKYLQTCISKNYAGKAIVAWSNRIWLLMLIQEHNIRNVKILKTRVLINIGREGEIGCKFDLPSETFETIIKKFLKEHRKIDV